MCYSATTSSNLDIGALRLVKIHLENFRIPSSFLCCETAVRREKESNWLLLLLRLCVHVVLAIHP